MRTNKAITLTGGFLVCGGLLYGAFWGNARAASHPGQPHLPTPRADTAVPRADTGAPLVAYPDSVAVKTLGKDRLPGDSSHAAPELESEEGYQPPPALLPDPLRAPVLGHDTAICAGTSITVHAGKQYTHYAWNTGDTTESIAVGAGIYSVKVQDCVPYEYWVWNKARKGDSAHIGYHREWGTDCSQTAVSPTLTVKALPLPELGAGIAHIDCKHVTGTITLHPGGGSGTGYTFRQEGGPTTAHPVFANLDAGDYTFRVADSLGCSSAPETFTIKGRPERTLLTSATATDAHCPGSDDGAIRVNIDHGTQPFTFSLDGLPARPNNVFSHVFAGAHTIIVQSDFCNDTLQVSVGGLPPIYFSPAVGDETSLHNGRIALHPNGGTRPFDLSWDHTTLKDSTLEHLPAATYTVHLTDGYGCQADTSITVRSKLPLPAGQTGGDKKGAKRRK